MGDASNLEMSWRSVMMAMVCLPVIICACILYYCWAFFTLGDYRAKWDYNGAFHDPYVAPLESASTIALIIFALVAIWRLVRKYRKHLDATSSAALEYDPIWLRNIMIGLAASGAIYAALEITDFFTSLSYNAAYPFLVLMMGVMAWFAIEATWRLIKPFPKLLSSETEAKAEISESKDWSTEAELLKTRVTSEQWYLESRLSIRDVATRMGTNETYLSRTLNRGIKQSFNRFINGLRIEHAKQLIKSTNN